VAEEQEILVVVSKLKNYIRDRSGFNTAGGVAPALSDHLRRVCDAAIENARKDGRKTVMDRDLPSMDMGSGV
jgi:histone H3/H4